MNRKKLNCQILVHLHLIDWKMQFNITNEFLKEEIYPHFQTKSKLQYLTVQFSSVIQSCPSLCYPMDCSMPGLPVHHQPPEFTQTQVLWVGDAIQPSYLLSSSSPTFNLSQHQGLFKWVHSSHQIAKVLEFQLQHQSFQWIFRTDFLYDGLVGSPCSPRDSQESPPIPSSKASILRHSAFFIVQVSHPYMTTGNHSLD